MKLGITSGSPSTLKAFFLCSKDLRWYPALCLTVRFVCKCMKGAQWTALIHKRHVYKRSASTVTSLVDRLRSKIPSSGTRLTRGLTKAQLERFGNDNQLLKALDEANQNVDVIIQNEGLAFVSQPETDATKEVQRGYVQFYHPDAIIPHLGVAARGPWIVSLHGAVIHDNGGYGMLGCGHNPEFLTSAVAEPRVMANSMSPAIAQAIFFREWSKQVGFTRPSGNPYSRIVTLNSGSEAVEFSARLTDVHAKLMTAPGAVHAGRRSNMMCLEGSFYGRTYRAARLSHSCRAIYQEHLASFQSADCHLPIVVRPNDIDSLTQAFEKAEKQNLHIEALYMEPVMGEGRPGEALDRKFYDAARALTKKYHSLLIIDSIQASLRAKGTLSIVDYPGFADAEGPDMETYSKALNAGQFPLSVLAMQEHIASKYPIGLYGNTMTTNPRGLSIGTEVLRAFTPAVRENVVVRGTEFQHKFGALCTKYPRILSHVTGSGLLQAVHLQPSIPMFGGNHEGTQSFLSRCRQAGLGVINAGHAIKFTPHLSVTSPEVDLMVETVENVCRSYGPSEVSSQ